MKNYTQQEVVTWNDRALKSVIASTNPNGIFKNEVTWAKEELTRRGVDFTNRLSQETDQ